MRVIESLRRAFRRHRRLLAALAAAIAVLAGLTAVRGDADAVPVLIAARVIPAGSVIADADVRVAHWPADLVPDGALRDPGEAIGKTVVAAIPARDAVAASDFLEGGSLAGAGMVAMPVRFGSGVPTELLRVGDHVDLIGAGSDGGNTVLVNAARIVAMPAGSGGGLLGGDGSGAVLVEVTPAQAAALATAAGVGSLSFALR